MEYIYFVVSVAAVGLILNLLWRVFVTKSFSIVSGQQGIVSDAEAIPLRKNTVCGLSKKDMDRIELQTRIDIWQRSHAVRRMQGVETNDPVSGKKYEYVPPKKSRVNRTARRSTVARFEQQFELLD